MAQWMHSLLAKLALVLTVSSIWLLADLAAIATAQRLTVGLPPVAYVTLEVEGRGPIAFTALTKDGAEIARGDPTRPGVLLPPGDYILRAEQHTVPVTVRPATQLPQGVDFLASVRKPPRLSERYVNAENANFWFPVSDGRLTRWYNSRSLYNGPYGFGWTFDYGARLERRPEGHLQVLEADGYMTRYHPSATGPHTSLSNSRYPSVLIADAGRVMRRIEGPGYLDTFSRYVTAEVFDAQERLRTVRYATEEVHEVTYEGNAVKAVVDQGTGKTLFAFESDAAGHITAMVDPTGQRFHYTYEGDRLTGVTGPDGALIRYRYDSAGREFARYPFTGRVAAGPLTWIDGEHVAVADLEPLSYRSLDLTTGQLAPASESTIDAALAAIAELQIAELQRESERRPTGYQFFLRLGGRPVLLVLRPEADAPPKGFTVYLADFGTIVPDLAVLTAETVVLAARRPGLPVLSIALADGSVRRLAEGPVLTLMRFGSDVWALYADRVVQYLKGREAGVTLQLPTGVGTPQGFTPLSDGTFLLSYLQEHTPAQPGREGGASTGKRSPWVGCEEVPGTPSTSPSGKPDSK